MVFILNLKLYNMRLMQVMPSEGEGGGGHENIFS